MKVLVTGAAGQLGHDVCRQLEETGIAAKGVDKADFDLTNERGTLRAILDYHPDAVVHCAAWTAVDQAEASEALCMRVNVDGTRNVARACGQLGAKMLFISTDYVFSGKGTLPFETDAPSEPINVYGRSKALGEKAAAEEVARHFILRTSWVFGAHGNNFVKTMLRLGRERESLDVVMDQVGSPTYSVDLAALICSMVQTERFGVYHATNEGFCSWSEFAQEIMCQAGLGCAIHPVLSRDYPSVVIRPLNSRLSKKSLDLVGFPRLPYWKDALARFLAELG